MGKLTTEVAAQAAAQFPQTPTLTLAKKIYGEHPELYNSVEHARDAVRMVRGNHGSHNRKSVKAFADLHRPNGVAGENQPQSAGESLSFEENGASGVLTSRSHTIKTLDDLMEYAKVDLDVWEVERYVVNKWDMGYKNADHEAASLPLYQIKAWLKRRVVVERIRGLISEMLLAFKQNAPKQAKIHHKNQDGCLLEVSIFDLHLGKLCWAPESGQNYDTKIAADGFRVALEELVKRTKGFHIERILFPVGNDFFNVDNMAEETTGGTPQREDGRWQKSFVAGRKLMVDGINRLRLIAPVDVVMVPGNHDTERVFYLGEALAGWFSETKDVTVDNTPRMRKYYQYGKNLIGLTHGKEEKHINLPLIMATEVPAMWASTRYREFHCGHWHHKKDIHFQPTQEFNGIRVRLIPSLCPSDDWHRMKGYDGLRAAEAYVWDRALGNIGSFSFSP